VGGGSVRGGAAQENAGNEEVTGSAAESPRTKESEPEDAVRGSRGLEKDRAPGAADAKTKGTGIRKTAESP